MCQPLQQVANHPLWHLLIHQSNSKPYINDPRFLLSANFFSPLLELELTLSEYERAPLETVCRFPARMVFLSQELNFELPSDPFSHCVNLQDFLNYVPFDEIELVFASEVLSSATSMMGHIFIKASGENFRQNHVTHSLAYFTEITTLNPFRLVVDSTLAGMPGFFIVRPFSIDITQYLEQEQRNLWQFRLAASKEQIRLLQLHIWELNQIEITYLFQSFNCATLTLEMLALLKPELLNHKGPIVSPADVVKAVIAEDMVTNTAVKTSSQWLFRALRDSLPSVTVNFIDQWAFNQHKNEDALVAARMEQYIQNALVQEYIAAIAKSAIEQQLDINPEVHSLVQQNEFNTDSVLDLSFYKHPAKTPQDSALGLSFFSESHKEFLVLSYLPAGHLIQGDNRQYLTESELIIGKTAIALNLHNSSVSLQELTIYSVKNFTPNHRLYPVLSGEFYLGYRPQLDVILGAKSAFELTGGVGKSAELHRDMLLYGLVGTGINAYAMDFQLFAYAKSGLLVKMIHDSKLNLELQANTARTKNAKANVLATAVLSWYPAQNTSISLKFEHVNDVRGSVSQFGFDGYFYF